MRFWVLILALLCGPLLAQSDPDLGAMNDAALNAFQQGDLTQARVLAERALTAAQNLDNPDPDAFVFAHNNVAYLLSTTGSDMARAARIWDQALAFLRARQRFGTAAGLTVLTEYSAHNLRVGNPTRAGELMSQASQAARATPFQGNVAQLALGFYLETAQYQNVVVALREVVLSNSALLNGSSNDLYSQFASHISTAEETGDWDTVFSLLEAKKILIQTYYPENLRQTATRELEFQRFNARHRAGQSELARQEMRLWLSSDTTTEDDRAFIDDMTRNAEKFADNIAINSLENLAVAQIAAQSVGAKPNEDNPRLGLALSNIALAESKFGRHDLAQATMQRAIPILERSETGRTHLSSVYAQLAWITNLAGDPDRAIALYDLSDAAAEASPGVDPTAVVDAVWLLADQTVFLTENGFLDAATARLARAQAQIATQAAQSSDPWMLALTSSRLKRVGFWLDLEKGQATQAIAPWLAVVDDLRKAAPENSVDFSAALIDIAQIVGFSGDMQSAKTLAREAVALNDAVLPDEANDSKVARTFLAQVLMQTGDRADAQRQYRRLTQAHKSPAYRENLPEVSWDFELFAWLLIDTPTPPPPAHVDEAFQALQWTQVTRSAEALQFLETRLSVDDPGRGGLLRERQDIQEQHSALSARLAASVANTARDPAVIERLSGELAKIDRDMSGIDGSLAAMGVGNLGLGAITPMSVADVQATLADDEMVVTFVLASLQPAAIPGLESSANHIVAITADRVHIARMGEPSRRTLRARIQAFRCDVAISDPGCSGGGAQGLRGAMQAGGPKAADPRAHFDFDAAHSLYRDLFGGLDGIIENYPNLIIAPPSDMLRLPFAALVTTPGTPKRLRRANWMIRS
ncbi:MAG: hypothetical protein AB8B51_16280, partial [Sedimentitalea sp.]